MNFVEFEGKDPEEAIANACAYFQSTQDKLEIEIVTLGSSGLFGLLGGKKAKIRASLKEEEFDLVPLARGILTDILTHMQENCTINAAQEADQIKLAIEGEDAGLLIGKQGQTLEALQYLVSKILAKKSRKKPRVVIDIESYRERHTQSLVEMAQRYGDKAKRLGKPVSLAPMNAHDRRIVHLALQTDRELKTKSRGEGLYKKVIIYPVKKKVEEGEAESLAEE